MQRGHWLGLAAVGCGAGQPVGLELAPDPVELVSEQPAELKAWAVDARGAQTSDAVAVRVEHPDIAAWDGRLRCLMSGRTEVVATLGALERRAPLTCDLVHEVALPRVLLVEPGPLEALVPELLGHEGQLLEHPWTLSSSDPAVVDGLEAKAPGEALVTVTAGMASNSTRVLVGRKLIDEQAVSGLEQGQIYPMEPGRYAVRTTSDSPAGIAFVGGPESCRTHGLETELECTTETPSELRVQNLNAAGAWEGRIRVYSLQ